MKPQWYANKWITVLLHSVGWGLLFYLPNLLRPTYNPNEANPAREINETAIFWVSRISDAVLICFFYLNSQLFFPRLFYKKKYALYCLAILGGFAFFVLQGWLLRSNLLPEKYFIFRKHLFFSGFIFMFILASSIAYTTIRDRIVSDKLATEKENEFLRTELSLLRSQVSPHFMFNVLNNMVALARKKSEQLEPSLIKLSSLMRYMLYETGEEKVSLEKETEYLQSYIDLQQQRFGRKVVLNVNMNPPDRNYYIEPMLLIPFVENAFKHGTGMIEQPRIDIHLNAENNELHFSVQNKYNASHEEVKDDASGIGLINVQRRLQLLYGTGHRLSITRESHLFTVSLTIHLS